MYSTLKRLATFGFVLSVVNLIATALLVFYFMELPTFAAQFTWILYTFTASIGFALISWALFDFSKDLERENNSTSEYIHKLSKRIKELEDRTF